MTAYEKEFEHHTALADVVTANRKAVQLSTTLCTQGLTDFLHVLDAQAAGRAIKPAGRVARGFAFACKYARPTSSTPYSAAGAGRRVARSKAGSWSWLSRPDRSVRPMMSFWRGTYCFRL